MLCVEREGEEEGLLYRCMHMYIFAMAYMGSGCIVVVVGLSRA